MIPMPAPPHAVVRALALAAASVAPSILNGDDVVYTVCAYDVRTTTRPKHYTCTLTAKPSSGRPYPVGLNVDWHRRLHRPGTLLGRPHFNGWLRVGAAQYRVRPITP